MKWLPVLLAFACSSPSASPPDASIDLADSRTILAEVDRMKDQLKDRPKTFEILSALGNLYYENGRFLDAVDSFRQALAMSAPVEADAVSLEKKGVKAVSELPLECRRTNDYGLAQVFPVAQKLDEPRRLRCELSVLEMAVADRARRGNSYYLIGNPDSALADHKHVLERSPDYPESLFFVGAILLEQSHGDKAQLEEGKKYWKRLLVVAPDHPRAALVKESLPRADEIFAPGKPGGAAAAMPAGHPDLPPGHPSVGGNAPNAPMAHAGPTEEQVRNIAEAVENTERTPELEKGLDDLTAQADGELDQGKYQEARDTIVRVMPMRPQDPRTAAIMGGAMRGLGRVEMAERTLSHALQLDPKQPRALYEMGKLQAARGDKAAALASLRAARDADPKWAQRVDEEIARLK